MTLPLQLPDHGSGAHNLAYGTTGASPNAVEHEINIEVGVILQLL